MMSYWHHLNLKVITIGHILNILRCLDHQMAVKKTKDQQFKKTYKAQFS